MSTTSLFWVHSLVGIYNANIRSIYQIECTFASPIATKFTHLSYHIFNETWYKANILIYQNQSVLVHEAMNCL